MNHLVMTNIISHMKDPPIFKNGKPSISMGHGFHGYGWLTMVDFDR